MWDSTPLVDVLRTLAAAPIAYGTMILFVRISGKRSLASLNAFDLLVTVAMGSLLASTVVTESVSLLEGATAIASLLALQWIVTRSSVRWPSVRKLVRGSPRFLVRNGEFCAEAARSERVTQAEVEEAMRKSGHGRYEDVEALILETDGSFSVIGRTSAPLDAIGEVRS